MTLLKGDLTGIVKARKLSQATMRNIARTCSSPLSIMRAADVLYPAFGILLSPVTPLRHMMRHLSAATLAIRAIPQPRAPDMPSHLSIVSPELEVS